MRTEITRKNEVRDSLISSRIKPELRGEIETVAEITRTVGYLLRSQQSGLLVHDGGTYLIDYSSGTTRGTLLRINETNPMCEVHLSFRAAKKAYGLFPVVLVSLS